MSNDAQGFSTTLASSLYPQLVKLTQLASLNQSTSEDLDARGSKLEIAKQATQLRMTLSTLKSQAQSLPQGEMGLDDQEWLIQKLQQELGRKQSELVNLAKLIPETDTEAAEGNTKMEID